MTQDIQDSHKAVSDWKEYVRDLKEFRRVFAWIWQNLSDDEVKKWFRRMLGLLVLDALFILGMPYTIRFIFDGLAQRDATLVLGGLAGFYALIVLPRFVAKGIFACRERMLGMNVSNLDMNLGRLFFGKSMGQHLQEHGYLSQANVEKGRNRIIPLEETILFHALQTILQWITAFALLFVVSPIAGGIMSIAFVIHILWALHLSVSVNQTMAPLDKEFRRINRYRVERWDHVERVKANGKEEHEVSRVKRWFDEVLLKDRAFWDWYHTHMITRGGITSAIVGLVLAFGAWQAWNGVWTLGLLYPLFSWSMRVRDGFSQLSDIEMQISKNLPSIRSVMQTLEVPSDIVNGTADAATLGESVQVAFDGISHDYANGGGAASGVIRGVSFTVEEGEKVALIGKSGAGKTTIMRLFLRYMDPSVSGRILLNGRDLREFDLPTLKRRIGYIPQQAQLFDGTLRYNLTYGLSDEVRAALTDEHLWTLMRTLQIDFGDRLVKGLDTNVGRGGVKLSGGEAQRVMIGAAALKDPLIMIIDEATSSLDALTERLVHEGLRKVLKPSMNALIITHRLPTVRDICTKFVVLRPSEECADGQPQVEAVAGSFEELYRVSPTFRRLADEQGVVIDILRSGNPKRLSN